MTENTPILSKAQTVALAYQLAGAGASEDAVAAEVTRILNGVSTGSPIVYAFDSFEKRAEGIADTKTILGTVIHVDVEESSQRGVIFLKSESAHEKWNPLGKENVRTERIDGKEIGLPLVREASKLIGHKVALTVNVEETPNGKVRVAQRVSDRGVDAEYSETAEAYTPDLSKVKADKLRYQGSFANLKAKRAEQAAARAAAQA